MKNLLSKFYDLCEKAFIDDRFTIYSSSDVELLTDIHMRYRRTDKITVEDAKVIREILARY